MTDGPGAYGPRVLRHSTDLAAEIIELRSLGRTERWKKAIDRWSELVLKSTDPHEIHWSMTQHAINAAYAGR